MIDAVLLLHCSRARKELVGSGHSVTHSCKIEQVTRRQRTLGRYEYICRLTLGKFTSKYDVSGTAERGIEE